MCIVARCSLVAVGTALAGLWAVLVACPQSSITGAIVGTGGGPPRTALGLIGSMSFRLVIP